jgi:pheromone receptor transcription factor
LTGTQVLLLVVSETGLVYTFTTVKLQPIVTKPEGKNLIQSCLNAPDPAQAESNVILVSNMTRSNTNEMIYIIGRRCALQSCKQ